MGKERCHGATNYKACQRPPPVSKPITTPASKSKPCSREKTESKVLQPLRESNITETAEAVKPKLSRRYAYLTAAAILGSRHLAAALLQFDVVSFRLKPHYSSVVFHWRLRGGWGGGEGSYCIIFQVVPRVATLEAHVKS